MFTAHVELPTFIRFEFNIPINAIGLAVMNWSDGDPVELEAYDAFDTLIESVVFEGALIDGTILGSDFGNPWDVHYGFMGLFSTQEPISYAIVREDRTIFDDLYFGVIPEPGTLGLFGLSVLAGTCWRRRKLGQVPSGSTPTWTTTEPTVAPPLRG